MRMLIAALVLLFGCTHLAGCSDTDAPTLENRAPYWCQVVPKSALAAVQRSDGDATTNLSEHSNDGPILKDDSFGCRVDDEPDTGLGFYLGVLAGKSASDEFSALQQRFENRAVTKLPSELGRGGASLYTGWLYWGCDGQEILLYLVLSSVTTADPEEPKEPYVIGMLAVAQERYAELAGCEVRPPQENES